MGNVINDCSYPTLTDCDLCPNYYECKLLQEQNKKANEQRMKDENKSV